MPADELPRQCDDLNQRNRVRAERDRPAAERDRVHPECVGGGTFTPGVSCPVGREHAPAVRSPLVGTESTMDGSFSIIDVPVKVNIPLVIGVGPDGGDSW